MIKSVGGGKFKVFSEGGRPMSKAVSKAAAVKRLHQVEFFKHRDRVAKRHGIR